MDHHTRGHANARAADRDIGAFCPSSDSPNSLRQVATAPSGICRLSQRPTRGSIREYGGDISATVLARRSGRPSTVSAIELSPSGPLKSGSWQRFMVLLQKMVSLNRSDSVGGYFMPRASTRSIGAAVGRGTEIYEFSPDATGI